MLFEAMTEHLSDENRKWLTIYWQVTLIDTNASSNNGPKLPY